MKKVRFELPIDVVEEAHEHIGTTHEVFRGEDKAGKVFLLVDKLTGYKQVAICKQPALEEGGCAQIEWFPIPEAAVIIDDEVQAEPTNQQVIEHVSDCFDVLSKTIINAANDHLNNLADIIGKEMDALKSEGCTGTGISEKTLLKAIEIVAKSQV